MNEQNQSQGQTQNVPTKKAWYKKWWGILLVITFFPVVVPYLVWTKTTWNKWIKITITITCVILFISILADSDSSTNNFDQEKQEEFIKEAKESEDEISEQKEAKESEDEISEQFEVVFDIPSLLQKDIDEIREILGQPTDQNIEAPENILNNQRQLGEDKVMETWGNTFKSGDFEMLVSFYIKDRKVKDFFVGASEKTKDKQKLLKIGNLTENDPRYKLEFIEVMNDKDFFTGLKVMEINEANKETKIKEDAENRKKMIEKQFSAWDGSHTKLSRLVKDSMNDPKSYEHVETTYRDMKEYLIVNMTFRGKNAFGGTVKNSVKAKISLDGENIDIIEQY